MILGLVCARAGSVGLPGKNTMELGGTSLLDRAIQKCIDSAHIHCVAVNTDIQFDQSKYIHAEKAIIHVPRLPEHAGPAASKWPVYQDSVIVVEAITGLDVTIAVDIDVSRPLTTAGDIDNTIVAYHKTQAPVMLAMCEAKKNPFYDTYMPDGCGHMMRVLKPGRKVTCRQNAPPAYEHGGITVMERNAMLKADDLWDDMVDAHEIKREHCFDIDDELDWLIVKAIHLDGACV